MKKVIAFGVLFTPFIALAQLAQGTKNVTGLVLFLQDAMKSATVLILAAAVVFFLWNVFKFVMAAGDEEKRKEGQSGIIYGIIGIAVMVSIYGLVNFLTASTVGTDAPSLNAPNLNF